MCNVGGIDKVLRIVVGGLLVVIALDGEQIIGQKIVWAWIGLVPLLTGMISFCPTYTLIGFKTCNTDENT